MKSEKVASLLWNAKNEYESIFSLKTLSSKTHLLKKLESAKDSDNIRQSC